MRTARSSAPPRHTLDAIPFDAEWHSPSLSVPRGKAARFPTSPVRDRSSGSGSHFTHEGQHAVRTPQLRTGSGIPETASVLVNTVDALGAIAVTGYARAQADFLASRPFTPNGVLPVGRGWSEATPTGFDGSRYPKPAKGSR